LQDDLDEAADWFATDMATKNYYGGDAYCHALNPPKPAHCDSLGRMPPDRVKAFGYPQGVGENIAAGFSTAQSVFDAWKASSGHNANMLGSSYKALGIGRACNPNAYYKCYWVTDFGFYLGPGATNPPLPTTPVPTRAPTPTATPQPTPSPTPVRTPVPTQTTVTAVPTPATQLWDDIDCDRGISAQDAVDLLLGDIGFVSHVGGCPIITETLDMNGELRTWGDTDCVGGVEVLDSINLLAYVAGIGYHRPDPSCPLPGTLFGY
jgi:hypothetical protein